MEAAAPGPLSVVAGVGLVMFEAAELRWLGFQPLELMFALVGAAVVSMALLAGGAGGAAR